MACRETAACRKGLQSDGPSHSVDAACSVPLSTGRLTSVARTEDITTVAGPEEGFYHLNGTLQSSKVAALSRTFATWSEGRWAKELTTSFFRVHSWLNGVKTGPLADVW